MIDSLITVVSVFTLLYGTMSFPRLTPDTNYADYQKRAIASSALCIGAIVSLIFTLAFRG